MTNEDLDVLTVEERNKLEWIMAWDMNHNLDWNWWYIKLYFQEHRRYLVDRFQAELYLMESGDNLEETKTVAFDAPETADDFCEKKKLQDEVKNLKLDVTRLEAIVDTYNQAATLAARATTTEVITLFSPFLRSNITNYEHSIFSNKQTGEDDSSSANNTDITGITPANVSELVCSGIGPNMTAFAFTNKALRAENEKLIKFNKALTKKLLAGVQHQTDKKK